MRFLSSKMACGKALVVLAALLLCLLMYLLLYRLCLGTAWQEVRFSWENLQRVKALAQARETDWQELNANQKRLDILLEEYQALSHIIIPYEDLPLALDEAGKLIKANHLQEVDFFLKETVEVSPSGMEKEKTMVVKAIASVMGSYENTLSFIKGLGSSAYRYELDSVTLSSGNMPEGILSTQIHFSLYTYKGARAASDNKSDAVEKPFPAQDPFIYNQ